MGSEIAKVGKRAPKRGLGGGPVPILGRFGGGKWGIDIVILVPRHFFLRNEYSGDGGLRSFDCAWDRGWQVGSSEPVNRLSLERCSFRRRGRR